MAVLRTIAAGLRSLFRRKTVIREMDEELGMFLDMAAQEKMQKGLSHDDALREVRLERGSLEIAREAVGSAGWESVLETFRQDIRFGFRTLRQHPGFAAVVVTTLALGIGANTAIFSLINALMLRTLPVRNPGTLVELFHQYPGEPAFNGFSLDSYKIIRDGNHVLSDLLVDSPDFFEVRGETLETQKVIGGYLSGNFFESLGLRPAIGRFIGAEADDLGSSEGEGPELMLGDIVLARGVCEREAAEKAIPVETHATHLLVHGTLHLLGYDHHDEDEAADMEGREVRAHIRPYTCFRALLCIRAADWTSNSQVARSSCSSRAIWLVASAARQAPARSAGQ